MIDLELVQGLKPGQVIETQGIFPGISPEKLVWEYLGSLSGKHQFRLSYCGVHVGHRTASVEDGELRWGAKL